MEWKEAAAAASPASHTADAVNSSKPVAAATAQAHVAEEPVEMKGSRVKAEPAAAAEEIASTAAAGGMACVYPFLLVILAPKMCQWGIMLVSKAARMLQRVA
jgi:hypothetical protein